MIQISRSGGGRLVPMTRNLGYFAIPQAWFSMGDAKPVGQHRVRKLLFDAGRARAELGWY